MRFVIAGATGFVGGALCAKLEKDGHHITTLTRDVESAKRKLGAGIQCIEWGGKARDNWRETLNGADVVINLAGEPVAGQRWTSDYKERISHSRVEASRALVAAIGQVKQKPAALISASAVGYYGNTKDADVTEETPPGTDFLSKVCVAWETETRNAALYGVREARLRIGIALGNGGALKEMLNPLPIPFSPWKLGLGGPMGSGRQWFPWIHIADVVGLFAWAAENPQVSGPLNATAPLPVTSAKFAHAIGRVLHRPALLPVPGFALKLALGEFADSLLGGQKAFPVVAERLGYAFQYREVSKALADLL